MVLVFFVLMLTAYYGYRKYKSSKTSKYDTGVVVYGNETCPWCIRQKDYLDENNIPYMFVDCNKEKCPDGIIAFPTMKIDGQMQTPGFKQIKYPVTTDETVGK